MFSYQTYHDACLGLLGLPSFNREINTAEIYFFWSDLSPARSNTVRPVKVYTVIALPKTLKDVGSLLPHGI